MKSFNGRLWCFILVALVAVVEMGSVYGEQNPTRGDRNYGQSQGNKKFKAVLIEEGELHFAGVPTTGTAPIAVPPPTPDDRQCFISGSSPTVHAGKSVLGPYYIQNSNTTSQTLFACTIARETGRDYVLYVKAEFTAVDSASDTMGHQTCIRTFKYVNGAWGEVGTGTTSGHANGFQFGIEIPTSDVMNLRFKNVGTNSVTAAVSFEAYWAKN